MDAAFVMLGSFWNYGSGAIDTFVAGIALLREGGLAG
jgi:hypothetical protein